MGLLGREENDSPGLADGNSRRDVAIEKELFHTDDIGLVFVVELVQAIVEHDQPFGIGILRCRLYRAVCHRFQPASHGIDDAKTADSRPRIDSHCPHRCRLLFL
jgi:hypothetical protein